MTSYIHMYPPSIRPFVDSVVSINEVVVETFLSIVNDWHEAYQEMSASLMPQWATAWQASGAAAPVSKAAASAAMAPPDMDTDDAIDEDDGGDASPGAQETLAVDVAVDVAVAPHNAALAILTHPAQAAAAAAAVDSGQAVEDMSDDASDPTSDDIAEEIRREAAQEAVFYSPADLTGDLHGQREHN